MLRLAGGMTKKLMFAMALIVLLGGYACRAKEKTGQRAKDIQWAYQYLEDLPDAHYGVALCAAANAQMITEMPEKANTSGEGYDFRKISKSKSIEVIKQLVKRRVDVDYKVGGKTALIIASQNGHHELVKVLLLRGANPLVPDKERKTALQHAEQAEHTEVIDLIQQSLDDIASVDSYVPSPHKVKLPEYSFPQRDTVLVAEPVQNAGTTDSVQIRAVNPKPQVVETTLPGGKVYSRRIKRVDDALRDVVDDRTSVAPSETPAAPKPVETQTPGMWG
ncbi:MAG: ankyrin repeat domain-containing protein [Candidatus Cloacimonadaceae bacterium]|nr:ankyrin repeat domain-containing protein [Candidatus Cloacimonadaceae bacterium]